MRIVLIFFFFLSCSYTGHEILRREVMKKLARAVCLAPDLAASKASRFRRPCKDTCSLFSFLADKYVYTFFLDRLLLLVSG